MVSDLSALRVAFCAVPRFEVHLPKECGWAKSQLFMAENLSVACVEANRWNPNVTVVIAPEIAAREEIKSIPGIKIGVLVQTGSEGAEGAEPKDGSYSFFDWLTHPILGPGRIWGGARILQTLPPPVDMSRLPSHPVLTAPPAVLIQEAAQPPSSLLNELKTMAPVRMLSATSSGAEWIAAVTSHRIFLHHGSTPPGLGTTAPLLALAAGELFISNLGFPSAWGIEQEDEILVRSEPSAIIQAVQFGLHAPAVCLPIRARAWQKSRELFSAERAFFRLVHDALLFAHPEGTSGSLRGENGRSSEDIAA